MLDNYVAYRRDTGEAIDFPVEWAQPEDAQQVWRWNGDHNPYPVTQLSAAFASRSPVGPGAASGSRPRAGIDVHGYRYGGGGGGRRGGGSRPTGQDDELDDRLSRIDEIWEHGWRARIEQEAEAVARADYDALSLTELVRSMERCRDQIATHMDLMFGALDIISYGRDRLSQFLGDKLGADENAEELTTALLEGYWNASLEANAALWDVAQLAKDEPRLRAVIESGEPGSLRERLAAVEGAAPLLAALEGWLDRYGGRAGDYGELIEPTWREDPAPVAVLLRGYLDREDPRAAMPRAAARRQAAAAQIEARLDAADRPEFAALVAGVAPYIAVKESRNSVMTVSRGALRQPALAVGRKLLAAGAIDALEDVFFLDFEEIEALDHGPIAGLRQLIADRRAEYAFWRNVVPPVAIGEPSRAAAAADEGSIKGLGASKGRAQGRARLILSLADADRLQPGDVLVTTSTTSAWTPLFLNAAAVVTDSGGILSHCAVVARELALPAVVGTLTATRLIPDGALIDVDGTSGQVALI